jgi:glycosyltransferase involved in cell wall biosynthesis
MNILCITSYYKPAYIYGGPSRSVPALCEAMAEIGANITVFTTNANGPGKKLDVRSNQPIMVDGVEVHYFPISTITDKFLHFYFYSPALAHACRTSIMQFDAVYIVGNWTYPVHAGAMAAHHNNIPYVISPRGSLMTWSMNEKRLKKRVYLEIIEKRIINNAATIHVTGALEEQQLHNWKFRAPASIIPNGIDLQPYKNLPERGKLRKLLGIPSTAMLSLFVGRLHKMKRPELAVRAFAIASQNQPDAHFLLVGSDQDGSGKQAQELAFQLGVADRVHFAGQLIGADLTQAYVDSDLLVLLSYRENFGMVVIEAMATGLPVIISKDVGLAEDVEIARAGYVVNAVPEEAGSAWLRLLSDRDLLKEMGKNAKALVWERFESGKVATNMLELCKSIVDKRKSLIAKGSS